MKKYVLLFVFLVGCGGSSQTVRIDQQNRFAVRSAKSQLWNEAAFRWKRIIAIEPKNANAFNNLGVAYEALGKIDLALSAYETATQLDPDDKNFRYNYRKCRFARRKESTDEIPIEVEEN